MAGVGWSASYAVRSNYFISRSKTELRRVSIKFSDINLVFGDDGN